MSVQLVILHMFLIVFQKNVSEELQVATTMKKPSAYLANNTMLIINFNKNASLLAVILIHKLELVINAFFHLS
jgi:hypothetical protein